jgi:hypothetical protein
MPLYIEACRNRSAGISLTRGEALNSKDQQSSTPTALETFPKMTLRALATFCIVAIVYTLPFLLPSFPTHAGDLFRHPQARSQLKAVQQINSKAASHAIPRVINSTTTISVTSQGSGDFDWKAHVGFFVLGIQKGGTTSLYKYLKQHPQIQVPVQKETRCFQVNYHSDDPFCERYFANPKFRQRNPQYLTGDFSPGYLWKTESTIPRVHSAYPHAKFIVTLRHPIERAFSQYRMHKRNHAFPQNVPFRYSNITFASVCMDELEIMRQEGLLPFWHFDDAVLDDSLDLPARIDVYREATVNLTQFTTFFGSSSMVQAWRNLLRQKTMSRGMVQKGLYAVELHRWMEAFPREQFLVISLEETSNHTESVMKRIHAHLGIEHVPVNDTAPLNTATDRLTELVSDEMQQILAKVYMPFDAALSQIVLGDSEWHTRWTYEKPYAW